jgi:hypothetical protein
MNDLAPSIDLETGQVILEGLPAGAAGEATLVPVPGVDLAFDLADGHLSRVVVDTDTAGGENTFGVQAAALLTRQFGQEVLAGTSRSGAERPLSPEPALCLALSRLARLDATRVTSPVACSSPWWAAETADQAERADLRARARIEARRAVCGLAKVITHQALPDEAHRTALAVANIVAADDAEVARQLRESLAATRPGAPRPPGRSGFDVAAEVEGLEKDQVRMPGLQWVLDPGLIPEGLFRPGLSPYSDLSIRHESRDGRIVVEAQLAPGAECCALDRCRARLVDPEVRRVLAQASFTQAKGQLGARVRAELVLPFPLAEVSEPWVEVVAGEFRPVRSARGHWIRRALRWADAGLRAERRPAGLAPQSTGDDWAALATVVWERCRRDWESAGDADKAFLAACRLANLDRGTRLPEAPSTTAARLARRPQLVGPTYLAELLGE